MPSGYYHDEVPEWLAALCEAPSLCRLRDVGMNCGCEYTRFPIFQGLEPYSRYRHSLGCALIVWHFTGSMEQSIAALLHDIATPIFAHTIDFLNGDYMRQESTEEGTESMIRRDAELCRLLRQYGAAIETVKDYHMYPIADNASPRLSADRLEYTLGNIENYRIASREMCKQWYEDLCVDEAEGEKELCFRTKELAESFAFAALECSKIYVCPVDRYAVQRLSELMGLAIDRNVITYDDLYTTEAQVIGRIQNDQACKRGWELFRSLHALLHGPDAPLENRRVIPAKKRWIDPMVCKMKRVSELSKAFCGAKDRFLEETQTEWICAE